MGPLHRIGNFFHQIGKFCNRSFFIKSEHDILDILNACTAKIAVSVDLLKRIRWMQLTSNQH